MADDLVGVEYRAKFVMQTFAAAMIIIGGLRIENFHGFLGIYALPLSVSVILTALLTIFIINAINLIDGIDGLASGLSAVACGFYAIIFLKKRYVYVLSPGSSHVGNFATVFLIQCVRQRAEA